MIDILIGAVIILSVFIGVLFVVIGDLKKEIKEVVNSQHVQDEEIYELMKSQYQHSEIITYLTD